MSYFRISKLKSLVDEVIRMRIVNLDCSKVTLHARLIDQACKDNFTAYSYFNVDRETKEVDMFTARSLGGTYSGVAPMGLFWSQVHDDADNRIFKRHNTTTVGLFYTFKAYEGYVPMEKFTSSAPLCETTLERVFIDDNVQRIPVRSGRLRGTLFVPTDQQQCPAVLDIYGMTRGLAEYRAALLASKGFVTLAIAYYGYEDLPNELPELDLTYFEEAIDYLQAIPQVSKTTGVGLIGLSFGSVVGLALSTVLPKSKLKAVVSITPNCGSPVNINLYYKDIQFRGLPFSFDNQHYCQTHKGNRLYRDYDINSINADNVLPLDKANADILIISGGDDGLVTTNTSALLAERAQRGKGGSTVRCVRLPGTGHIIDPPFMPHCIAAYAKLFKINLHYGGDSMADHANGAMRCWDLVQEFLTEQLCTDGKKKFQSQYF